MPSTSQGLETCTLVLLTRQVTLSLGSSVKCVKFPNLILDFLVCKMVHLAHGAGGLSKEMCFKLLGSKTWETSVRNFFFFLILKTQVLAKLPGLGSNLQSSCLSLLEYAMTPWLQ